MKGRSEGTEGAWRSYRCPVCGHVDRVAVPEGETATIRCSHCRTLLQVRHGEEDQESVSVRVAEDG